MPVTLVTRGSDSLFPFSLSLSPVASSLSLSASLHVFLLLPVSLPHCNSCNGIHVVASSENLEKLHTVTRKSHPVNSSQPVSILFSSPLVTTWPFTHAHYLFSRTHHLCNKKKIPNLLHTDTPTSTSTLPLSHFFSLFFVSSQYQITVHSRIFEFSCTHKHKNARATPIYTEKKHVQTIDSFFKRLT